MDCPGAVDGSGLAGRLVRAAEEAFALLPDVVDHAPRFALAAESALRLISQPTAALSAADLVHQVLRVDSVLLEQVGVLLVVDLIRQLLSRLLGLVGTVKVVDVVKNGLLSKNI